MWVVNSENKMNANLKDIGFLKHMADRLRSNISYVQIPLLGYTAVVSTLNYVPSMVGYLFEFTVVCCVLFVVGAAFAIYVDYKWVFKPERDFIFKNTPHLEKRFKSINDKLDILLGVN